jgi:hypothetical protein
MTVHLIPIMRRLPVMHGRQTEHPSPGGRLMRMPGYDHAEPSESDERLHRVTSNVSGALS